MRIILFILLGIASLVLTGSVFSFANIGGIVPDLLLMISLSIVFLEKTPASILFAAIAGLLYDIMFSSCIGFYALSYTMTIGIAYALLRNLQKPKIFLFAIVGFAGYIVNLTIQGIVVGAMGVDMNFSYMFLRFILPGALLNAALLYPVYYLIRILYVKNLMSPTKSIYEDF